MCETLRHMPLRHQREPTVGHCLRLKICITVLNGDVGFPS
jgi:hypothetical protein